MTTATATATAATSRAIVVQYRRAEHSSQHDAAGGETGPAVDATPGAEPRTSHFATVLPMAPFVAHLIATHQALPQTRARNRAEPAVAAVAYRSARLRAGS